MLPPHRAVQGPPYEVGPTGLETVTAMNGARVHRGLLDLDRRTPEMMQPHRPLAAASQRPRHRPPTTRDEHRSSQYAAVLRPLDGPHPPAYGPLPAGGGRETVVVRGRDQTQRGLTAPLDGERVPRRLQGGHHEAESRWTSSSSPSEEWPPS
ncbi:hypothetical protein OHA37_08450 [Streptomyces sp. NBC_00335]|uniref:hypothetical protein n=1 Tax=unclassified Streptomyces TaxID=2593676 RepID=UPI00225783C5|nr:MULTISPECIES: hypothetical protein [unclassified Streptomyces]MCX5403912.1 hypothetical protein [Streptomyces sp. NBC_00086]